MKNQDKIKKIEQEIRDIKKLIQKLGPFRPGTVSQQYKIPKEKKGGYYQLNYTFKMKCTTEYVRRSMLPAIKIENAEYKKFKNLINRWISISIQISKLKIKSEREL